MFINDPLDNQSMFVFLCFFYFIFVIGADIRHSIAQLHKKTPFRTFYELFNVTENTDIKKIRSNFKKSIRNLGIVRKNMQKYDEKKYQVSDKELERIITEGYNVLNKNKAEYDMLLKDRFSLPFAPETKSFFYFNLFITVLFTYTIIDILLSFLFYLKRKKEFESLSKKERKKQGKTIFEKFSIHNLFLIKFFSLFKRKQLSSTKKN